MEKESSVLEIIKKYWYDLYYLFCFSNRKDISPRSTDEQIYVSLFLKYLKLKEKNRIGLDDFKEIFLLLESQKEILIDIISKLEQWSQEMQKQQQYLLSNPNNFQNYITELQQKILSSSYFILPTGYNILQIEDTDFKECFMLENNYKGFHPSCIIIQNDQTNGMKQVQVIDPLSPYQQCISEITKDKINEGIKIQNIPKDRISSTFLKQTSALRVLKPDSGQYSYKEYYELILSQLSGDSSYSNNLSDFHYLEERTYSNLKYTIVKKVVFYILKNALQEDAVEIFNKLINEFEFFLLINTMKMYSNINDQAESSLLQYEEMLTLMYQKVSNDSISLSNIQKDTITAEIEKIQQRIITNQARRKTLSNSQSLISNLSFKHCNYKNQISSNLKDLQFIKDQLSCSNSHINKIAINNIIENKYVIKQESLKETLINLSSILSQLEDAFKLNRIYQICQIIEEFVFSFLEKGFKNFCLVDSTNDLEQLSYIVLKASNLYYNCSAFLFQKLFSDSSSIYDPNQYTKLVLVMFSLYAIMQEIIKQDEQINICGNKFTGCTFLNESISLEKILPQLIIPSQKWFHLLKQVYNYFKTEEYGNLNLFDLQELSKTSSESKELSFIIELIQRLFPEKIKNLEKLMNDETNTQNYINYQILLTSNYMPKLLINYRDISYLARGSLLSFPSYIINSLNITSFSRLNLSYSCHWRYHSLSIQIGDQQICQNSKIDERRSTDYYLPNQQNCYQRIILSKLEKNSYISENEVIASQRFKPIEQSRKQFYSQSFIQLNQNLKFLQLFVALKNQDITFESEQECLLVRQIIQKEKNLMEEIQLNSLEDQDLSLKLIGQLCNVGKQLNTRQSQCLQLSHLVKVLIFLFEFCHNKAQQLIEDTFAQIRNDLQDSVKLFNQNINYTSIQSGILILTYKVKRILSDSDIYRILDARIVIENNYRMNSPLSKRLYYQVQDYILSIEELYCCLKFNEFTFLEKYITYLSDTQWKFEKQQNLYSFSQYQYIPLKGRILNGGYPFTGLPNFVIESKEFQLCCRNEKMLFEINTTELNGKQLTTYNSDNQNDKISISILNSSQIWIQSKCKDERNLKTFIYKDYLSNLPLYLKVDLQNKKNQSDFLYWYQDNIISVTSTGNKIKYKINLLNNEIYSEEDQMFMIPISQVFIANSNLFNLIERFENHNYIYGLKEKETDNNPVKIKFQRLGLTFNFTNQNLLSNDYKDYCLAKDQCLSTLEGLPSYIILEKLNTNFIQCSSRKLIIPNHPLKKNRVNQLEFDITQIDQPPYFTYEINEELGTLISETTAGNIFLSLLYYQLGNIQVDKLTQMNCYENVCEIFNNCWQNYEYTDLEFNIILELFEFKFNTKEQKFSYKFNNVQEFMKCLDKQGHGIYPKNINSHAIFLKLIILLIESFSSDFITKPCEVKKQITVALFEKEFNYHFIFYLLFKTRIYKRCQLTEKEEHKLISKFIQSLSESKLDQRIKNYYSFLNGQIITSITLCQPRDYLQQIRRYNQQAPLDISRLKESSYGRFSYCDQTFYNTINHWNGQSFSISVFFKILKKLLSEYKYNMNHNDFEEYDYQLQYWFSKNKKEKSEEYNVLIKILQNILQQPQKYELNNIPSFFNFNNNYSLNHNDSTFYSDSLPYITCERYQVWNAKNKIMNLISEQVLSNKNQIKLNLNELNSYQLKNEFSYQFENRVREYKVESTYNYIQSLFSEFQQKRKNYELQIYLEKLCLDNNLNTFNVGNQILVSEQVYEINLSKMSNQNVVRQELLQNPNDKNIHSSNLIDTISIQNQIESMILKSLKLPEQIDFPFDTINNQQSPIASNIFSSGYGKSFISELKDSYIIEANRELRIGYLQTPNINYKFKQNNSIIDLKEYLIQIQSQVSDNNYCLFQDIINQINFLSSDQTDSQNNVRLSRQSRIIYSTNKADVLKSILDETILYQMNPEISNPYQIQQKIIQYLEQFTLGQKINRALALIYTFEQLDDCENDKTEKERLLQQILLNVLYKRCYSPKAYKQWLLFEFQNNILVREQQNELIENMLNDDANSIYQLNMGEGKTSVILILLCDLLSKRSKIVRINCLEPLFGMMQDILKKKYSGMLKKKIYVLPFSRQVEFTEENINKLKNIFQEIKDEQSILLMTPEQRLCLQLKKQESLLLYLECKDADNIFDWQLHYNQFDKYKSDKFSNPFVITENQKNLKRLLEDTGYITSGDIILKYSNKKTEFIETILQKYESYQLRCFKGIRKFIQAAFFVLRSQSMSLKHQHEKTINQIQELDKYLFIDILDESDEILRHGKELNYTLGQSKSLDGGSIRWEIPFLLFRFIFYDQEIIELLKQISTQQPCPIVYNSQFRPQSQIGGGIFQLRLVDIDYFEEYIKPLIIRKISQVLREKFDEPNQLIENISEQIIYGSYEDYLQGKLSKYDKEISLFLNSQGSDMENSFLLLKGWLSHNIFYHVMSYRYRVEYGLSAQRSNEIAIPFKGKDLPSEKSEFSHPDIMIGFTILSYLYNGLSLPQFQDAIYRLKNEHREDKNLILQSWMEESKSWVEELIKDHSYEYPVWLMSFQTFEIEDPYKMNLAFKFLCRNFKVIKYYLSNFTFPNNVKHFNQRITGNAHSLVSESKTIGFSGTDDKADSMPESIIAKRLQSQLITNGKLVHILLREINSKYEPKVIVNSIQFLKEVCEYVSLNKNCFMLIDSGAVITEMSNKSVAKYLIKNIENRFQGVVYFSDKNNKIYVYLRNSQNIPFSTCHLDKRQLFVYLDEAHTRGSDFVLPLTTRGILTLGRGMNKDKLMQAAMRLRDLDFKQSIIIWGSEEISSDIAKINGIPVDSITSKHVIIWASANTVTKNEKDLYPVVLLKVKNKIKHEALELQKQNISKPLQSLISCCENIVQEGIDFLYRKSPSIKNTLSVINSKSQKCFSNFEENLKKEIQSIQMNIELSEFLKRIDHQNIINRIKSKLPESIKTYDTNFDCDEENEQEVEEVQQQEQQSLVKEGKAIVEKKWNYNLIFESDFIDKCYKNEGRTIYPKLIPIKNYFNQTSFKDLQLIKWSKNIHATQNYLNTINEIDMRYSTYQNDYMRPVNMILVQNTQTPKIILFSGQEASNIKYLLEKGGQYNIFMMHIDDNGEDAYRIPNLNIDNDDLKKSIITIRLLNGDSYFKNEEISIVKKCLGIVSHTFLHEVEENSFKIYDQLKKCQLIKNGQFTQELLDVLGGKVENSIIKQINDSYNVDIKKKLIEILDESILDLERHIDLLSAFLNIAAIRGKINQFTHSTLKNLLEIKCEWNI